MVHPSLINVSNEIHGHKGNACRSMMNSFHKIGEMLFVMLATNPVTLQGLVEAKM